jgi:predicted NBD/HSP70 family sugar kinase
MATAPARPALLRSLNDRTVLELLLESGPASRTELAARTGLSKPTVTEVLARLERARLVAEAGETSGRRGPNGRLYDAVLGGRRAAALAVEPGHVSCEIVDARGTVLGASRRTTTDLPRGAAAVTRALVADAAGDAAVPVRTVSEVVVSLPGSYDPRSDRVRYADRIPDWTVADLSVVLGTALPAGASLTVDNDVNLALVAERVQGIPGEAVVAALLWLGAGVGLATDLGGTLYRGASGGAGEVGYLPVPLAPAGTRRGRAGFARLHDVVGGSAVLRLAREHGISGRTPAAAVARAVAAAATDPSAATMLDELAVRIAYGLAAVVAVIDPGVVVLGGAVGRAGGDILAARAGAAFRGVSPLDCRIVATAVAEPPALAGARAVAAEHARARLLDDADRGVATVPKG